MIYEFTLAELDEAIREGSKRQANNEQKGRPNRYGATGGARIHKLGAAGELAFCKAMGLEWTGKECIRAPDAEDWEVRTTFMTSGGSLIVHPKDHDDRRYVLVHPVDEFRLSYCIVGWILGADAKNDDWWKTERKDGTPIQCPAFFVPQSALTLL